LLKYHEEVAIFLAENDGFFPSIIKEKDRHFLNSFYILKYYDKLKISRYDAHYPFINSSIYDYLSIRNLYTETICFIYILYTFLKIP